MSTAEAAAMVSASLVGPDGAPTVRLTVALG